MYLESDYNGLSMRTALVDITMPEEQQTGRSSRRVCKEPSGPKFDQHAFLACVCVVSAVCLQRAGPRSKALLERLAENLQGPPPTPVVGNVLVRHGMLSLEAFWEKIASTHPHRRSVTVEIAVPRHLIKCPPDCA